MEITDDPDDIPTRSLLAHAADHYERCRRGMLRAGHDPGEHARRRRALDEAHDHLVSLLRRSRVVYHRNDLAYRAEGDELHRTPSSRYRNTSK